MTTTAPPTAPPPPAGQPRPGSRSGSPRALAVAVVAIAAVLGLVLGLAFAPSAMLADDRSGDPQLSADVEAVIGNPRGLGAVSVGRLTDGKITYAGLGEVDGAAPTPQTPYELGSITKTFTGMLLADAVQRCEVQLTDPVAAYLTELGSTAAGASTLQQLATHTSGLPTLPPAGVSRVPKLLFNDDPDADWTTERVITAAGQTPLGERGTYAYSNLGMSLLGHALARAAGVDSWTTLADKRLLQPLKMTHTTFLTGHAAEPAGLASPHRASGWPAHTWTSEGYLPAGVATRTTAEDMMRFAQAIINGKAPGLAALKTSTRATDRFTIGLAWHAVSPEGEGGRRGDPVVWHNGGTGGTRTMLALDLKAKQAVLVLNNSSRTVDDLGINTLISGRKGVMITPSTPTLPVAGLIMLGIALLLVGSQVAWALRSRDRVHVVTGIVEGACGVALALIHGPWSWLPGGVFGVVAGVAFGAAALGVLRMPDLPTWPARRRPLAVAGLVFTLAVLVVVIMTG